MEYFGPKDTGDGVPFAASAQDVDGEVFLVSTVRVSGRPRPLKVIIQFCIAHERNIPQFNVFGNAELFGRAFHHRQHGRFVHGPFRGIILVVLVFRPLDGRLLGIGGGCHDGDGGNGCWLGLAQVCERNVWRTGSEYTHHDVHAAQLRDCREAVALHLKTSLGCDRERRL